MLRSGTFANGQLRWKGLDDGQYSSRCALSTRRGLPGCPPSHSPSRPSQYRPVIKPAPDAVVSNAGGQLLCTQVAGAVGPHPGGDQADFNAPVLDESRLDSCTLSVAQLPVGRYFWRAASVRELPGAG